MILHDTFATTPLDRTSLPQGALDVAQRVRTNPLPWTGQFSPQLVEKLLAAYAPRHGAVLDPFAGSGTSLVEAARLDLPACGATSTPRRWPSRGSTGWSTWTLPGERCCSTSCASDSSM